MDFHNTRENILKEYHVYNRIILNPGKFELTNYWTPYFYELFLTGFHDGDFKNCAIFYVTEEHKREFPELNNRKKITLFFYEGHVTSR